MAEITGIDGRKIDDGTLGANAELVAMLRDMLRDAEAGHLVTCAGVFGFTSRGKLDMRLVTVTNNWEVHDRLLARVGALRTMMENDMIENMKRLDPIPSPDPGGGGDAA